ncbi:hypothetical protein [Mycobacterium leprae]|nr:hypothetical protein [Mycobacterium leprae]
MTVVVMIYSTSIIYPIEYDGPAWIGAADEGLSAGSGLLRHT